MAQVDFVNYFSIIIWFNFLFIIFYLLNYSYILPIIYNNICIRVKRLQYFVIKGKSKYGIIFLLVSKNFDNFFNSYNFCRLNINIYNLYSNFLIYKIALC